MHTQQPSSAPEGRGQPVKCLQCGTVQEGILCATCETLLPVNPEEMDYFRIFSLVPRPWIDEAALERTFLRIQQRVHPDRYTQAPDSQRQGALSQASRVNQAYRTLRDPRERLRYLWSLETGEHPPETSRPSPWVMALFMEVSEACQGASGLGSEASAEQRAALQERLEAYRARIQQRWQEALEVIQRLDERWMTAPADRSALLEEIRCLSDDLSYLNRLQQMVKDHILGLESPELPG